MNDHELMGIVMEAGEKLNHCDEIKDENEIQEILHALNQGMDGGNTKAYRHMARCYEHGFGADRDFDKALELYRRAADGHDTSAIYYLGWLYQHGPEEIRDPEQGLSLIHTAEASGNRNAVRSGRILCKQSDWFFIDFSPVKDVLLKNPDGTLSPMDEPWFTSTKICENVWMFNSAGDYSYVISDGKEGIAIDGGYGAGNIRKYMEKVSGVPVHCIANTHDHFDHTANNAYFDHAYMTPATSRYAAMVFPSFKGIDFFTDTVDIRIIHEGDSIPVGSKNLEVYEIADHAPGSAFYLDRADRLLIVGDELFPFPVKGLNNSLDKWYKNMLKLEKILPEADLIYGGSGKLEKSYVQKFIDCAKYAWENPEAAEPVEPHPMPAPHFEYTEDGHLIYDRKNPHPQDMGGGHPYDPEDIPEKHPDRTVCVTRCGITMTFER